jgi:hypothetical protein
MCAGRFSFLISHIELAPKSIWPARQDLSTIEQRLAEERFEGGLYLLAEPSLTPVAGNLKVWPSALKGSYGWDNFRAPEWKPDAADRPGEAVYPAAAPDPYRRA